MQHDLQNESGSNEIVSVKYISQLKLTLTLRFEESDGFRIMMLNDLFVTP